MTGRSNSSLRGLPASSVLGLCLFLACAPKPAIQPVEAPPLPTIDLKEFAVAAREPVRQAYSQAQASPRDADANGGLGILLHGLQRFDAARACYERAHVFDPSAFRWLYYSAVLELRYGSAVEAAQLYRQALEIDPDYRPARLGLADALLENGDLTEARTIYELALEGDASSAAARYGIGQTLAAEGDTERAIAAFESAIALFPDYGAAHYALALAYRDLGKARKSEIHMARSQQLLQSAPPVDDPLLRAVRRRGGSFELVRQGVEHANAGRLKEAKRSFLDALEFDPANFDAHSNLIAVCGGMGDLEEAVQHYRAAAALQPNSEEIHYDLGVLMAGAGRYQEAARAFDRVLEINAHNADARLGRGYVHEMAGENRAAIASYEAATKAQPNHADANFRLGRLLLREGRTERAMALFRRSLEAEGNYQLQALYGLATAFAMAGDRSEAVRLAKQAKDRAEAEGDGRLAEQIENDLRNWAASQD